VEGVCHLGLGWGFGKLRAHPPERQPWAGLGTATKEV